jgi:hypothetical protein
MRSISSRASQSVLMARLRTEVKATSKKHRFFEGLAGLFGLGHSSVRQIDVRPSGEPVFVSIPFPLGGITPD